MKGGFLYFARNEQSGQIKVGWSVRPDQRVRQLSPDGAVVLLHSVRVNDRSIEGRCHRCFDHLRGRGEWFSPDRELLDFIDALIAGAAIVELLGETSAAKWFAESKFPTISAAAKHLDLSVSTLSRMLQPGYRASAMMIEHMKYMTGGKVILDLTERNIPRSLTFAERA